MAAATFQSTVNIDSGFGVPGELIVDGPQRVESLTLDSAGGTIGYAFTKSNTTNVATQGGTIVAGTNVFAGILVNPKSYASYGPTSGTLDPTLALPANSQGEFLTMGTIVVTLVGTAEIGDIIQYNTTTGVLSAVAPGTATPTAGNAFVPNAVVWKYPLSTAGGLTAIRLTN